MGMKFYGYKIGSHFVVVIIIILIPFFFNKFSDRQIIEFCFDILHICGIYLTYLRVVKLGNQ